MTFPISRKRYLKSLFLTAVFDTIIAFFLTQLEFGAGFWINFIFSQSLGICICSAVIAGHLFVKVTSPIGHLLMVLVSITIGASVGAIIGAFVSGIPFSAILGGGPIRFFQILILGLLFGTVITYFFFSREKIQQTEAMARDEKIKRLTLEKQSVETHLRLLQAQIEPHFLFNSLSNVLSLIETDPQTGKHRLADLTQYLRASLSRTRSDRTTLGQEVDLVRAYLNIHRIRMGERLRFSIDLPEGLKAAVCPPMLIQPLVENAVKHGLEPKVEGGEIRISVRETPESLRLKVTDTGVGLKEQSASGIGLTNIRERIQALYNGRGCLLLEENQPEGLKVTIEIPYERSESHHS